MTLWEGSRSGVYSVCNEPGACVGVVKSKAKPGDADVQLQTEPGGDKLAAWAGDILRVFYRFVLASLRGSNLWGLPLCVDWQYRCHHPTSPAEGTDKSSSACSAAALDGGSE